METDTHTPQGRVAQLAERRIRNARVVGSIPALAPKFTLEVDPSKYLYTDAIGSSSCRATIAYPHPRP